MNREQAKELLPIIQAFAEGKTIQVKSSDGLWYGREGENCEFNFNADPQEYRIKSEPKYRPFANAEESAGRKCRSIGRSDGSRTKKMIITH